MDFADLVCIGVLSSPTRGSNAFLSQSKSSTTAIALLFVLPWFLTSCRSSPKHYFLQGRVLGKSDSTQQITVNHGNIPGFMAAMTMPYPVKDARGFQEAQGRPHHGGCRCGWR
jgi:hypothetical protein